VVNAWSQGSKKKSRDPKRSIRGNGENIQHSPPEKKVRPTRGAVGKGGCISSTLKQSQNQKHAGSQTKRGGTWEGKNGSKNTSPARRKKSERKKVGHSSRCMGGGGERRTEKKSSKFISTKKASHDSRTQQKKEKRAEMPFFQKIKDRQPQKPVRKAKQKERVPRMDGKVHTLPGKPHQGRDEEGPLTPTSIGSLPGQKVRSRNKQKEESLWEENRN